MLKFLKKRSAKRTLRNLIKQCNSFDENTDFNSASFKAWYLQVITELKKVYEIDSTQEYNFSEINFEGFTNPMTDEWVNTFSTGLGQAKELLKTFLENIDTFGLPALQVNEAREDGQFCSKSTLFKISVIVIGGFILLLLGKYVVPFFPGHHEKEAPIKMFAQSDDTEILKEKKDVISLLQRAEENVEYKRRMIAAIYNTMNDSSSDKFTYAKFFEINPLKKPYVFFQAANNELVLKNINAEILESFETSKSNIDMVLEAVNKSGKSNYFIKMYVNAYGIELWYIREILKLSIEYLDGKITYEVFDKKKQNLIRMKLGLSEKELRELLKKYPRGNFDISQINGGFLKLEDLNIKSSDNVRKDNILKSLYDSPRRARSNSQF